jgi:hypothetical protein
MLKASDNLTSYRIAAGEPFLLSVQVRDKTSKSVISMAQRPLVLSFYRTGTRETVAQIEGIVDTDASGEFVRFARDGTLSDGMYGQSLTVELAERFKAGRAAWAVGRLEVTATAGGVETFGDLIGRTESRITVYHDAAGVPRAWEQEQVPFSAAVEAPPRFTTPASISSDGTPQVGELLTGIDGAATDAVSYVRQWLLGSTVMTTLREFRPQATGDYAYEVTATGPGGSTTSTSHISVAAATPVPQPSYSLSGPATIVEGNSGTAFLNWTLTLNRDGSTATFPFSWEVAGSGSFPADAADFGGALPAGTGAFAAGETVKTISVPVSGDVLIESDETLLLTVTAAGLGTLTATGTIGNDDVHVPVPTLSISSAVTQVEGNSGTTAFAWTLTLNRDGSTAAHPFSWSTAGSGANPADAADFGGTFPSGSGTFAPGETSKTIVVLAAGDAAIEPNDTFTLTASGSGLNTVTSTGTISNDDVRIPAPTLSLSAALIQNEGQSGTTAFVYTLTLARDGSTAAIPYSYAFTGAGTNPADAADFGGAFPSGSGTFAAGETTKTITALVTGDTTVEPHEGLLLTVQSPGLTSVTAGGTISNDDAAPAPTIAFANPSVTVAEGNSGTTAVPNTVIATRNGAGGALTINLAYGGTATAGTDYAAPPATVTIPDGQNSVSFDVSINGDTAAEVDETIIITASLAGYAATATKTITVSNDDATLPTPQPTFTPTTTTAGFPAEPQAYAMGA